MPIAYYHVWRENDMKPEHTEHHAHKPKQNIWMPIAIILGVLLLISLLFNFSGASASVSIAQASDKALKAINDNLAPQGITATLKDKSEEHGLYKLMLTVQGQDFDTYVSKDGALFFPNVVDLDETSSIPPPAQTAPVDVSADDDPSIGPADAKVTVIEFSDFQCPFCGAASGTHEALIRQFNQQDPTWTAAVPELKKLAQEGKIRLVFRDFPLNIHPDAPKAAEAAECAEEQDRFWDYHDKLFENQEALSVDNLKQYAKDLKLNTAAFNECLDSGKMKADVDKDFADGAAVGVSGTPAFFINGRIVEGAQSFTALKKVIDEELAK